MRQLKSWKDKEPWDLQHDYENNLLDEIDFLPIDVLAIDKGN